MILELLFIPWPVVLALLVRWCCCEYPTIHQMRLPSLRILLVLFARRMHSLDLSYSMVEIAVPLENGAFGLPLAIEICSRVQLRIVHPHLWGSQEVIRW